MTTGNFTDEWTLQKHAELRQFLSLKFSILIKWDSTWFSAFSKGNKKLSMQVNECGRETRLAYNSYTLTLLPNNFTTSGNK